MTASAWEREAEARRINAQPWQPLPGMARRRCDRCSYWFAVPMVIAEATPHCPDCASRLNRAAAIATPTVPR
jgi:hypothetical protein